MVLSIKDVYLLYIHIINVRSKRAPNSIKFDKNTCYLYDYAESQKFLDPVLAKPLSLSKKLGFKIQIWVKLNKH